MENKSFFFNEFKQNDVMRWLAFGLIALAVVVFYFPSLFYPPRADQVIYLAETSHQHPVGLIFSDYDHNRHRTFAPGDELLFRPLLYAILGCEQVFFGHHFWAWQMLGIVAHLVVVWMLLRLLWHLTNPWLAVAATWVFALSVVNYEMVTWTHLSSYMLMMACMVAALEQAIFCFEDGQITWDRINRILIYSLVACFIYETANIFVLSMAGALLLSFPRMKWRILVLITPVILYVCLSYINFTCINHITHLSNGITHSLSIGKFAAVGIYLTLWWIYEGLFNGLYHYFLAIRTMFQSDEVLVFKSLAFNNVQVVLELMILASWGALAWINRRQFFDRIKASIVVWGMVFAYVMVIVAGRYQEMGSLLETVRVNSYFPYILWVMLVIIAFLSIPAKEIKNGSQRVLMAVLVIACIFSGLWQGKEIYHMASGYSRGTNNSVLLITTLDLLIEQRGNEPDFSFYVDPRYPGNYPYGTMRKVTDPPNKEYTFAELLYPQYFRPKEAAKYKLLFKTTL